MIYLDLLIGFLKVGLFSIGGAYGSIPLIRDVVLSYGWMSDENLAYMIAVSESTPGPIMINMATYVGSSQAGFFGAAIATAAVALPSFIITLLVTAAMTTALKNRYVQAVLKGLNPCIIGIILATGIFMVAERILNVPTASTAIDGKALLISLILFAVMFGSKRIIKKQVSPIGLILISAVLGIIIF